MDSKDFWDIYRFQDCGPDPFVAPVVSDSDEDINTYKAYKGDKIPKWKEALVISLIILGEVLVIVLSEVIRRL